MGRRRYQSEDSSFRRPVHSPRGPRRIKRHLPESKPVRRFSHDDDVSPARLKARQKPVRGIPRHHLLPNLRGKGNNVLSRLTRQGYRRYLRNYFSAIEAGTSTADPQPESSTDPLPSLMQDILEMVVAADGKVCIHVRSRDGRLHVSYL